MKMKKVFLSIMGFALAGQALAAEPADEYKHYDFAIEFTDNGTLYFRTTGANTVEITFPTTESSWDCYYHCDEPIGDLVIPESVTNDGKTYSVTSIGTSAFDHCIQLTSVTIPGSIKSIGGAAFWGCSFETATILDGVTTICDSAFFLCSEMQKITIPKSVTSIGRAAFCECRKLKVVTLPDAITNVADSLFYNCNELDTVNIPKSATRIGVEAFASCRSWRSAPLVMPDGVVTIADKAFIGGPRFDTLVIPSTLTSLGVQAFEGAKIKVLVIPDNIKTIPDNAFSGCEIESIILKEGVTTIEQFGLYGNRITSLVLPSTITKLDYCAFDCSTLKSIVCLAPEPPTANFVNYSTKIDTVYVPANSVSKYKASSDWEDKVILPIEYCNVTVTTADNTFGTVSGEGSIIKGEATEITAIAADGYRFVMWSDNVTDNPRTITVTSDTTFTAVFEAVNNTTAVDELAAAKVNIYTVGNTIVVENAADEIRVYNVMGRLVARNAVNAASIRVDGAGVYIVKTGAAVKRVVISK
jgi:hypothetical protein